MTSTSFEWTEIRSDLMALTLAGKKYGMLGDYLCGAVDCWTDRGKIGKGWCNKIGKNGTIFRLEFPTGDYRIVNYTNQMLKTSLLLELHTMWWIELFVSRWGLLSQNPFGICYLYEILKVDYKDSSKNSARNIWFTFGRIILVCDLGGW